MFIFNFLLLSVPSVHSFQKARIGNVLSLKTFHKLKSTSQGKEEIQSIGEGTLTSSELFRSILFDKVPVFKKETEDYLLINSPSTTLQHPYLDGDIDKYVSKVLSSDAVADSRLKPLFAVVTGMGRGKTRMLVEMKRKLNEKPNVFCLALTFNGFLYFFF